MSVGLRRWLALWLAGGAELLLLLMLAHQPPAHTPRLAFRPRPAPAAVRLLSVEEAPSTPLEESEAVVSSSNAPFNDMTSSARAVPSDEPAFNPPDKSGDKLGDKVSDKSGAEAVVSSSNAPFNNMTSSARAVPSDEPAFNPPDKSGDKLGDKVFDKSRAEAVVSSSNAPFNNMTSSARAVPSDEPAFNPPDKSGDKLGDKVSDKSRAEAVVSSSNAPFNDMTSSARAVPSDEPAFNPPDKSGDKLGDKVSDKSGGQSPDKSGDKSPDKSGDNSPNKTGDMSSDEPANKSSDKPAVKASVKSNKKKKVVLTKELYIGGHSSPHPERCPLLGAGIRVLVLVTSAPSHRDARDAIRLTWGHFAQRSDVAMAFVIGRHPDELKGALEVEDSLYGDLISGNLVDTYSNLALKTLSMLEWFDKFCPRAAALLKTDDDMFINVPRLLQFIDKRIYVTMTIFGKVRKNQFRERSWKSKYYLSRVQYPGRVLPDFTTGPAYLLTRDAVGPLLRAAADKPYVRLEDVFVTGILANAVGVKRVHVKAFYNKKISPHPCVVQRGISMHKVRYHEQFDLWRKLLDNTTKCRHAASSQQSAG